MTGLLIGGFFELELPSAKGGGFLDLWGATVNPTFAFANARSAFAALIEALQPPKVWLPAYICREMAAAVPAEKLAFYPVGDGLTPQTSVLQASARPGDIVLAVNFFGRAPATDFLAFAKERVDLCLVEDCAQSIVTGLPAWGNWRLFSPRKLVGVPDGGLLVAMRPNERTRLETAPVFDVTIFDGALRRFEDEGESDSAVWHAANQAREKGGTISRNRMSRLSRTLLRLLNPQPVIRRRRENFAVLQKRLAAHAFLKEREPSYAPFGFPIRANSKRRDALVKKLALRGIFAARHWSDLPSPAEPFDSEHRLAGELLTLPCDQRYGTDEMEGVAAAVEQVLS